MTILAAKRWNTNAHMLRDAQLLGYVGGLVYDMTPGDANALWWRECKGLTKLMLNTEKEDFTNLPFPNDTFDTVAFDPPFKCVSLDTEILTQRGWQTWETVTTDDVAYTLNHETGLGEWQPVEDVIVLGPAERHMIEIQGKSHSSLTTADHQWPTTTYYGVRRWTTTEALNTGDYLVLSAKHGNQPTAPTFKDSFVELVAWLWTEGHIKGLKTGDPLAIPRSSPYGNICQSWTVNRKKCERIRSAFSDHYGPSVDYFPRLGSTTDGTPRWREAVDGDNIRFVFSADIGREFLRHAPGLVPSFDFLSKLTSEQLELFIKVSMLADGSASGLFTQRDASMAEVMQMACALAGKAMRLGVTAKPKQHRVMIKKAQRVRPCRLEAKAFISTDPVWCVTTANSTWLARRNHTVYFTGNCNGTKGLAEMNARYGVDVPASSKQRHELMKAGLAEAIRITKPGGHILAKCHDQVANGKMQWQTDMLTEVATAAGCTKVDEFLFLGHHIPQPMGPSARCPNGRKQRHAHGRPSSLLVFQKK